MIYQYSRYTNTDLYDRRGTLMFKHRERINFGLENSVIHVFNQGDRLDKLASKHYGTSQLWWVILDANPKYRCELDIEYGDELVIPHFNEVRKCLNF